MKKFKHFYAPTQNILLGVSSHALRTFGMVVKGQGQRPGHKQTMTNLCQL